MDWISMYYSSRLRLSLVYEIKILLKCYNLYICDNLDLLGLRIACKKKDFMDKLKSKFINREEIHLDIVINRHDFEDDGVHHVMQENG